MTRPGLWLALEGLAGLASLATALAGAPLWFAAGLAALGAGLTLIPNPSPFRAADPRDEVPRAEAKYSRPTRVYSRPTRVKGASGLGTRALLLANFCLALLLLWSASETTHITLRVENGMASLLVDGRPISNHPVPTYTRAGIYMEDYRQARNYVAPQEELPPALDATRAFTDLLQRAPFGPAWAEMRLDGHPLPLVSGHTGWSTNWRGEIAPVGTGYALLAAALPNEFTLEATLVRGAYPAGILLVDDASKGELLLLGPEHREHIWKQWDGAEDGAEEIGKDTSHSAIFGKDLLSMVQDVLRLLLSSWLFLLPLWLAGLGLAACLQWLARRFGSLRLSAALPSPALAAALSLAGLLLTASIAWFILEAIPHVQDDVTYLFQAKTLALGQLWVPSPPDLDAFQQEFMVNHQGKWFGKYPPGFPLVLALGVLVGLPWLVNPLLAGGTLWLVYLAGREMYWREGPLDLPSLGGRKGRNCVPPALARLFPLLLLITSPFFLFMSGSLMAHSFGLFLAALFLLAWVRMDRRERSGRWALVAGAALGWLFLTRPLTGLAIAFPFGAWLSWAALRHGSWARPSLLLAALGALPFGLVFLAYNTTLTGNPLQNPMELYWAFDRVGFGPGIGMSYEGHTPERGLWNAQVNLQELQAHLWGWPSQLTLSLPFIPFVAGRARSWDWRLLAIIASLVGAYVFWWAEGIMYGPRYYFEGLAVLALLTTRGLEEGGRFLAAVLTTVASGFSLGSTSTQTESWGYGHRGLAAAWLLAGLLMLYNALVYLPGQVQAHRGYNYVNRDALRAVRQAGIDNALIFVRTAEQYAWWEYGAVFPANSPQLDGPVVFAQDVGPERNRRLMEHFLGRSFYLMEGAGITPIPVPPSSSDSSASSNSSLSEENSVATAPLSPRSDR